MGKKDISPSGASDFSHGRKVTKSPLRGFPPEYPLWLPVQRDRLVGIGRCPACGGEGGNWERSGHSRPALWRAPSPETPGFCVLSSYFCTAGGKFDRTANKNTPPQEPAAKREGRVQNGSHCLISTGTGGTAAPEILQKSTSLCRHPTGSLGAKPLN